MIMNKEVSTYCLAAIANYSAKNPNDELAVTTKSPIGDQVYLEVSTRAMTEDGIIESSLLSAMTAIAESWGGWAHVEYDRSEDQLLIVIS